MKKLLSAVLALAMMLTLVACGNTSKNDADNNEPEVVAAPVEVPAVEEKSAAPVQEKAPVVAPTISRVRFKRVISFSSRCFSQ